MPWADELDGARAVWPNLCLIRSLCEIEFELDRISTRLMEQLQEKRAAAAEATATGSFKEGLRAEAKGGLAQAMAGGDSAAQQQLAQQQQAHPLMAQGVVGEAELSRLQASASNVSLMMLGGVEFMP